MAIKEALHGAPEDDDDSDEATNRRENQAKIMKHLLSQLENIDPLMMIDVLDDVIDGSVFSTDRMESIAPFFKNKTHPLAGCGDGRKKPENSTISDFGKNKKRVVFNLFDTWTLNDETVLKRYKKFADERYKDHNKAYPSSFIFAGLQYEDRKTGLSENMWKYLYPGPLGMA